MKEEGTFVKDMLTDGAIFEAPKSYDEKTVIKWKEQTRNYKRIKPFWV